MFRDRPSLLWLLVPPVLFVAVLPLVNRVHPTVLGIPFFPLWMIVATLLTPVCVRLAAAHDPVWHAANDAAESSEEER